MNGDRNVISESASETVVNKPTGIPPIFATEVQEGGKFIQRKDLNGIAHFLSLFQAYMQVRSVISFDQSVCDKIGGYPKGAVLAYVDTKSSPPEMFFIESTVEDNTAVPVPSWKKNATIDDGHADSSKAWHKLTPSWRDLEALNIKVKVVDRKPTDPDLSTFYFIKGEGVTL